MVGDALDRLATLCGVASGFRDAWGQWREVPRESRAAIIACMGHDISTAAATEAALRDCQTAAWREPLPPVMVAVAGKGARQVPVSTTAADNEPLAWSVRREDGGILSGEARIGDLAAIDGCLLDGQRFVRRALRLPDGLPLGYHHLDVRLPGGVDAGAPLVVAPERCYLPASLAEGGRTWGLSVQLYAMRSARNWGMGDFGDLARLVAMVADAGGDAVGINPLHALFPDRPERCSPYAPSSRLALNILYIDVEAVPELADCDAARASISVPAFRQAIESLRAANLVDFPGIAARKLSVLRLLYETFRARHLDAKSGPSPRGEAFLGSEDGSGVQMRFATFEALAAHFGKDGVSDYNWRAWPAEYRDPRSPAVVEFAARHRAAVEFRHWLQWIAREQLHGCGTQARSRGMTIGLYGDLAIGADQDGADAWALGPLLARGASVGAPPDALNLRGQDWAFAPFIPAALRAAAFAPFSAMLRHNMRDAGALRIDHAIGLQHVYWVPHGMPADRGGYVRQPLDELLAVIALESVRNKCLVIGEDLGTLPEGLRERLGAAGVLSYRVLPFEREDNGSFRAPSDYPHLALVTPGTHDMPSFPAFWRGDDLKLRQRLDLFPTEKARSEAVAERGTDRRRLLQALSEAGIGLPAPLDPDADDRDPPDALVAAIHRFLAITPAALLLAQLEDLIGETEPVNVPGTADEYPNWRRKLSLPLEALTDDPRVRGVLALLAAERPRLR